MKKIHAFYIANALIKDLLVGIALIALVSSSAGNALAASSLGSAPALTSISPSTAPNDLNTRITITGAGFAASPTIKLGTTPLVDVNWMSDTELTASVPWGLAPGIYPLTVTNPDGGSSDLLNAFTVTPGFNVWTTDGPYGGEVAQVIMDPVAPATLFASAPNVGVFRSQDSGAHWQLVMGRTDLVTVAFSASADTLYAGGTDGLARSTDGGNTWVPIPGYSRAFPHPTLNSVVFAISANWLGAMLFKSEDGGQTWVDWSKNITGPISGINGNGKLVFDPIDPQVMYLGTESGNIYRSSDGGANWTFASRPVTALWDMAVNPFGAHEVWVGPDNRWGPAGGLVKSGNADLTQWISLGADGPQLFVPYIRFTPASWGASYAGTVYLPFSRITKTTNGGGSWASQDVGFFAEDLAFDPANTSRMVAGGYAGVQLSLDGGATWSQKNEGLTAVFPTRLVAAPQHPETVYALSQSGALYGSEQAGASWKSIQVSDETQLATIAVDPSSSSRLYAGASDRVRASNDGGVSWPTVANLPLPDQYITCSIVQQVLHADPVIPGRLLAGVGYFCNDWSHMDGGLYLSTNSGQSWTYLSNIGAIRQVNDILYDPQNPARVYAALGSGGDAGNGVLVSTDSGATWQFSNNLTTGKEIYSLAAEPTAPYRLYAASQYNGRHVYRSDNHGATWVEVATPPSCISTQGLAVMPGQPQAVYAATWGPGATAGLYRSVDGAQSWQRVDGTLGWVPIYSLAVVSEGQRSILYAGTTGGMANSAPTSLNAAANESGPVNAGVYRITQRNWSLYLPLLRK